MASEDRRLGGVLRDQRGATLVLAVLFLPVLVLMISAVIDVGNWFEHKRHLQMQADAAALAAALDLRTPCSDDTVADTAAAYGGRDYNPQVQAKQSQVHRMLNSQTYYGQASPVDTTVDTDPPCTALQVDVKLTETDLPWYFRLAHVPFINAHARVGLYTIDRYTGSLPLAVPEVAPKKVLAKFIDERTGDVLGTTELTRVGTANGLAQWDNAATPLPVTVDRADIGVRIVVSGTNSTTCGDPYVECFDAGSANGLVYLRGWSGAGTGAVPGTPLARDVRLVPGTCVDAYFSASTSDCTIGIRAKLDFGNVPTSAISVQATAPGNKQPIPLNLDPNSPGTWASGLGINVGAGSGPVPITLNWTVKGTTACPNKTPCTGTFGVVQRSFAGSDARSGPLRLVQISENGVPGADSIERCSAALTTCTHNLVVTVGVPPSLEVASSINDPVVTLRFAGGGSQSQGLDCDTTLSRFEDEIAFGCSNGYRPNQGTACPANVADLWATPNPPSWECVANQTGQYVNKIPKGLNRRILCPPNDPATATDPACADPFKPTACTHPNNWSQFATGLPQDDPRIVQLFVTQYGAFDRTGGYTVPIMRFATFYVTGWNGSGGGFPNPCQGAGDDPAPDGTIVGHFIKYIDTLATSTGSELCDMTDTNPCKPVMTE